MLKNCKPPYGLWALSCRCQKFLEEKVILCGKSKLPAKVKVQAKRIRMIVIGFFMRVLLIKFIVQRYYLKEIVLIMRLFSKRNN